jgi:desulfoferrodoxin (superoxide reductase-like protein)
MRGVFQAFLALAVVVRGQLTYDAMFAEMLHRQFIEHKQSTPFSNQGDILGSLHDPTMTYTSNTTTGMVKGKVLMGVGSTGTQPNGCPNGCVHPLIASNDPNLVHFITTIMIVDENNHVLAMGELTAEDSGGKVASLDFNFPIPQQMTPYAFCNIHGLWKGDTLKLSGSVSSKPTCEITKCLKEQDAVAVGSNIAALENRQNITFSTVAAFPVNNSDVLNTLHRPVLTKEGDLVKVMIGMGSTGPANCQAVNGCYHPVTASTDPATVHWPEYVYVKNEAGVVVFFVEIAPTVPEPVTLVFERPAKSNTLTAYVYCNIHGLFVSEPFAVSGGKAMPAVDCGF